MKIGSTWVFLVVAVAAAAPAAAQPTPPLPPECRNLPNGGRIQIDGPPITAPVVCQSCAAGIGVPASAVVGFSDTSHATCEFKLPNGDNTGQCRKETTCGPGFSRVSRNNVWVCEKAGPKVAFDCPAPPRAPDPPRTPAAVDQCIARLKQAEAQLATNAKNLDAAIAKTGTGGTSPESIGGAAVQAAANAALMFVGIYADAMPTFLVYWAACDNVDSSNQTSVNDCRAATSTYNTSAQRVHGFLDKFEHAARVADRELGDAKKAADSNVRDAATATASSLSSVRQAALACLAEIRKAGPR